MAKTTIAPIVVADTHEFTAFARTLKKVAPEIRAKMMMRLRMAGALVAEDARARASEFSTSIPPSIKVRISAASVVVEAGHGVPLAGLSELGNKGGSPAGFFRHPVFGNQDVWVNQRMHPFLAPAAEAKGYEAERAAVSALDEAVDEVTRHA